MKPDAPLPIWNDSPDEMGRLCEMVEGFATAAVEAPAEGGLFTSRLVLELPLEIKIAAEGSGAGLLASPPRQKTELTFMPVLHRLRITIAADEADDG